MVKKRIKSIVSILLCFFIAVGTLPVYAAGKTKPNSVGGKATVWFIFVNFREEPSLLSNIKDTFLIGKNLDIIGYEEDFIKVKDPKTGEKGYVFKILLIDNGDTTLKVTTYNNVYKGDIERDSLTIEYNGSKDITWSLSKSGVVEVTKGSQSNKLTVKGISPGSVVLTVRAGLLTATCDLHCYYLWNKEWTAKAKVTTIIRKGPGSQYGEKATLSKNARFTVSGDDGASAGWAYGYTTKNNKNYWGYVKINDISTKGTVSQYNNMKTTVKEGIVEKETSWLYPIKETKFKTISSPYGWRRGSRHLGLDINKGSYSTILGKEIIAPFTGKVIFVNKEYNYSTKLPNYGYCIILEAESVDPVSGNKLRVVFMHLNEPPSLNAGTKVEAGEIIGRIGTTGNSTGPHLHLEINNKGTNFAGMNNYDSFDKTINPIFFYLDSGLKDSSDSTYDEYWYNDNK